MGSGAWECDAIISPEATAGPLTARISFRVLVYNNDGCQFPPKKHELVATLKIIGDAKAKETQPPVEKKPPVLKDSITDKRGVVWMLNVDAAIEEARKENKLVFIDFAAVSCTYWAIQAKNVIPQSTVVAYLKEYVCVRLFIDSIPAECLNGKASFEECESAAEPNYDFMKMKLRGSWPPYYAVIRPTKNGAFEKVSEFSERNIDDVNTFVEFLKKPLKSKP